MTVLTARNEIVQLYVKEPNKAYKEKRLESLLRDVYSAAVESIYKLFTDATTRVIDEIVYLSSGAGICKIGAKSLAERCGYSVDVVYKAVKALKLTGDFTVGRIGNGHAGKYIFVDNKHENFSRIMKEVFHQDENVGEVLQNNNKQGLEQQHEQAHEQGLENGSELTAQSDCGEKNEPICFNSFISLIFPLKQVNNKYNNAHAREAIKDLEKEELSAVQEEIETAAKNTKEYVEQYATNDLQLKFYDFVMLYEGLYPEQITNNAAILALRLGSNCDNKRYAKAKDLIHSISMQIAEGTEHFENVVATFTAALNNAEKYREVPKSTENEQTAQPRVKVPFYNWLEERDEERKNERKLAQQTMNAFASILGINK